MVTLKAVPAVCGLLIVAKTKWCKAPAFTVKLLLVPVCAPAVLVAVMVLRVPAWVTVTLSVRTPLTKLLETVGLMVPALVVRFTVSVALLSVLFFGSCEVDDSFYYVLAA